MRGWCISVKEHTRGRRKGAIEEPTIKATEKVESWKNGENHYSFCIDRSRVKMMKTFATLCRFQQLWQFKISYGLGFLRSGPFFLFFFTRGKWLWSFMIMTFSWKVRTRSLPLDKTHRHENEVFVRFRCLNFVVFICHRNFSCQHELESNNNDIMISRVTFGSIINQAITV